MIRYFYLTNIWDPNKTYYSESEQTLELLQIRDIPHS